MWPVAQRVRGCTERWSRSTRSWFGVEIKGWAGSRGLPLMSRHRSEENRQERRPIAVPTPLRLAERGSMVPSTAQSLSDSVD